MERQEVAQALQLVLCDVALGQRLLQLTEPVRPRQRPVDAPLEVDVVARGLTAAIRELDGPAPLPPGCTKEVVIVDDGSTDGTTQLLTRYSGSPLIVVHHSAVNQGKGAALRIGISKATGDVLLVQDGDLEYDPNDYVKILEPIVKGEADVVYGSRFMQGVKGMKVGGRRRLTIPPHMGYGDRGAGGVIKGGETLVFVVDLIAVR